MNAEARRLGMDNTHFANPTGQSDAQNYSSAEDMAILAQRLLTDFPNMRRRFAQREFVYNDVAQANQQPPVMGGLACRWDEDRPAGGSGWSVVATASRAQGRAIAPFNGGWLPSCSARSAIRLARRRHCA